MLRNDLLTYSDEQLRFFDGYFSRLIQEHGACMGDAYYKNRVEQRVGALAEYDDAIVRWVMCKWPPEARPYVVHAGTGMGFLATILAVNGCHVLALDYYQPCAEAAQAVKDALVGLVPEIADRLTIGCAGYPEGATAVPSIKTVSSPAGLDRLLVFTNVGAGWDLERFERVVTSFVDYDYVILSLRLFGQIRESPEEWQALADDIAKWAPIAECYEFGVSELVPSYPPAHSWVVMRIGRGC